MESSTGKLNETIRQFSELIRIFFIELKHEFEHFVDIVRLLRLKTIYFLNYLTGYLFSFIKNEKKM